MIHAKFENPEKCSNIGNVAPDPGSCTRDKFVAAWQGPEFFVMRSSAGQRAPQAEGR
jgi:hypothetical protein